MAQRIVITYPDDLDQFGKAEEIEAFFKLVKDVQDKLPETYLSAYLSPASMGYFQRIVRNDNWPDVIKDMEHAEAEADEFELQVKDAAKHLNAAVEDRDRLKAELEKAREDWEHKREGLLGQNDDLQKELAIQRLNVADLEADLRTEQQEHKQDVAWYEKEIVALKAKLYDAAQSMQEAEEIIDRLQKEVRQNGQS